MNAPLADPHPADAPRADAQFVTANLADVITFSSVDGPGNRFVVFLQGCNFDCIACHNPQTIATSAHHPVSVDALLPRIRRAAPFLSGITVSGGEATQQHEFVHHLFTAVKADPATAQLTCFVDSNGACDTSVWDDLAPVMDGAMIDLKCLNPSIHERMTGQPNDQVLASIRHLRAIDRLYEVRLLIMAGVNDDPILLQRTGEWLATVEPRLRLKVIAFRLHGARPHDPPLRETPRRRIDEVAAQMQAIAPFDVTLV